MKRATLALVLLAAVIGTTAAPALSTNVQAAPQASHQKAHPAIFDKTRFLLHAGFAYYAFHHFVWAKWKAGNFKSGAPHRVKNIVEAAIAVAFTVHELKVAYGIAKGSSSKTLHLLIAPINAFLNALNTAYAKMKSGNFSDALGAGMTNASTTLYSQAKGAGYLIKDIPTGVH